MSLPGSLDHFYAETGVQEKNLNIDQIEAVKLYLKTYVTSAVKSDDPDVSITDKMKVSTLADFDRCIYWNMDSWNGIGKDTGIAFEKRSVIFKQ
ncbi:hypothetical protein PMAYCL1PPCAC_05173 [Pristionchus mayeri]|uniref:Uncharacterized protein n=1 Tax=Pristionchus mayeri TaxID=1317129 RepID=A0AAN4ZAH1_9BILA|nr:hypothetical protein PMAYCL1PPCAC_05173 [Pristionchus mayeri]